MITRREWGAVHEDGFGPAPIPAGEIWLHHSAGVLPDLVPPFDDDFAAVRAIEREGERRFGRGMPYTFLVTPAGLVFEGHTVAREGAHTAGHNTIGRAICWTGNCRTRLLVRIGRHAHDPQDPLGHCEVRRTRCDGPSVHG